MGGDIFEPNLRLVAWEVTDACNLACKHCRAEARRNPSSDEMDTEEGKRLLSSIARIGSPIVIFTGGEPLLRQDIFELISFAREESLTPVLAPNGTLLTRENVREMVSCGVKRVSLSIDGPDAHSHNSFRGVDGAFEKVMEGIEFLRAEGMPFQINTTVTRTNLHSFREIFSLVEGLGAVAWHIFLLVPTGRARDIQEEIISAEEYEEVLTWFYDFRKTTSLQLKATCAPHYYRIMRQRARKEGLKVDVKTFGMEAHTRGCLGGIGFCFVSHNGKVQPCGYLDVVCGDVRKDDFAWIWYNSAVFKMLRDRGEYKGKCGVCEYFKVCGGCRARAYAMSGDYMGEEPLCSYLPKIYRGGYGRSG